MEIKLKKLLAILLTFAMMFNILPVNALAEDIAPTNSEIITAIIAPETTQQEIEVGSADVATFPDELLATLTKTTWEQVAAELPKGEALPENEGEAPQTVWQSSTVVEDIDVAVEWSLADGETFSTAEENTFIYTAKLTGDIYPISPDIIMPIFTVNVVKAAEEEETEEELAITASYNIPMAANVPTLTNDEKRVVFADTVLTAGRYYKIDNSSLVYADANDFHIHLSNDSQTLTLQNIDIDFLPAPQHDDENATLSSIINSSLDNLTIHSINTELRSNHITVIQGHNLTFSGHLTIRGTNPSILGIYASGDVTIRGGLSARSIRADGNVTINNLGHVRLRALEEDSYALKASLVTVNSGGFLDATASFTNATTKSIAIDAPLIVNNNAVVNAYGGSGEAGGEAIAQATVHGGTVNIFGGKNVGTGIADSLTMYGGTVDIYSPDDDGIGSHATVSGGNLIIFAGGYGIAGGDSAKNRITGGNIDIKSGLGAFESKPTITPVADKQVLVSAGEISPGEFKNSATYDYTDKYVNISFVSPGEVTLAGTILTAGYHKFDLDGTYSQGTSTDYNVRLISQNGANTLYLNGLSLSADFADSPLKTTGDLTVYLSGNNNINNGTTNSTAVMTDSNITFAGGGSLIVNGNNGVGINSTGNITVTGINTSVTSTGDAANGMTAESVIVQDSATLSSLGTLNAPTITVNNGSLSGSSLTDYGIEGALTINGDGSVTASGSTEAFSQKPVINVNVVMVNAGDNQASAQSIDDLSSDYHKNKYVKIDFNNTIGNVNILGVVLLQGSYYLLETAPAGDSILKTEGADANNYHLHLSADGETLTMNEAVINTNSELPVYINDNLTIHLIGENSITSAAYAIFASTINLTIKADSKAGGTLAISADSTSGINNSRGNLNIINCTLKVKTENSVPTAFAHSILAGRIIIEDSAVEATGGKFVDYVYEGSGIWCTSMYVTNSTVTATAGSGTIIPAIIVSAGNLIIDNSILTATGNTAGGLNVLGNIRIGLGSTVNTSSGFGSKAPLFPAGVTVKVNNNLVSSPENGIGQLIDVKKVEVSSEVSSARTMLMDFSHLQYRSVQASDYGIQGDLIYLGNHSDNPVAWIRLNNAGLMLSRSVADINYDDLSDQEKIAVSGNAFSSLNESQVASLVGSSASDNLHINATTRPTFTLLSNDILFYTQTDANDVEGKDIPLGSFYKTADKKGGTISTSEWKLRIVDERRDFDVSNVIVDGNSVTYDYDNAMIGAGEYVSVLILDDSGKNILYYGKLLDLSSGNNSNRGNTFTLPDEITSQSSVKLRFINENESGTAAPNISSGFAQEEDSETNQNPILPTAYAITINPTSNGIVSTNPMAQASEEVIVAISITPNSGYELDTITVTDADNGNIILTGMGNNRTFTMPAKDVTIAATFKHKIYNISVAGGTASQTEAVLGTPIKLTAIEPELNMQFVEWVGADINFADKNAEITTFIMPTNDVTITAKYTEIPNAITGVEVSPRETTAVIATDQTRFNATVLGMGDLGAGVTWSVSYSNGDPTPHSSISQDGVLTVGNESVQSQLKVTATSKQTPYAPAGTAIVHIASGSAVTNYNVTVTNGSGSGIYPYYQGGNNPPPIAYITADTPKGKEFKHWKVISGQVNLRDTSNQLTYVLTTNPAQFYLYEDVVIEAVFDDAPATVESITLTPTTTQVQKGKTQQFVAVVNGTNNPDQSVSWTLDGNANNGTNIDANGLLTVAAGETAENLIIKATSTVDANIFATASITLSDSDIAATYEVSIELNGGISNNPGAGFYAAGVNVSINAGTYSGYTFSYWSATGVNLNNPNSASTSFTMPANAVTLTANWTQSSNGNNTGRPESSSNPENWEIIKEMIETLLSDENIQNLTAAEITEALDHTQDTLEAISDLNDEDKEKLTEAELNALRDAYTSLHDQLSPEELNVIDPITNVSANGNAIFDANGNKILPRLTVEPLTDEAIIQEAQNNFIQDDMTILSIPIVSYDISLQNEAINLQPNGDLVISFNNLQDYANESIYIAHKKSDGTWQYLSAIVDDNGMASITVNELSPFVMLKADEMALSFSDVDVSDWYYQAVSYVVTNNLMNGVSASEFAPNTNATRAMIWTVLARISDIETEGGELWYSLAQDWVIANSISDGQNPEAHITREELATMLYRYEQVINQGGFSGTWSFLLPFDDVEQISDWAFEGISYLVMQEIINGRAERILEPQGTATRAEIATILMRYLLN